MRTNRMRRIIRERKAKMERSRWRARETGCGICRGRDVVGKDENG